ncbi:POS5 [Candida pseudojiufengensis]|uniref:POS5 n=1 Tax=Candida pseudojiufengensis TaxID=497109 RepID=UPI00222461E9|nr:POS5 [Candida pseudojiufengensis]KAI5961623.1 POS5 [Candida pseudojiufengensis]
MSEIRQNLLTIKSCNQLTNSNLPNYEKSPTSKLYNIKYNQPLINVLMIKKPWDSTVREAMIELINHLHLNYPQIKVLVTEDVADELNNEKTTLNQILDKSIDHIIYTGKNKEIINKVDLMITLGGDGTILRGVSLFSNVKVPPVLSFAMGTLGFLLPFDFQNNMECFKSVYENKALALHRNRLECHVIRNDDENGGDRHLDEQKQNHNNTPEKREMIHAMNDVTIHRGSSPNLTSLDIYIDGEFFTTTYADGVIFSTPTGSTAYSLSAGGSITHPSVPCILLTPICPRSLSFRPLILPSTSDIMIKLSKNNRNNFIELTIDGISQDDLHPGDELHIKSETIILANEKIKQQKSFIEKLKNNKGTYINNIEYNDQNGIWCVANNENQWAKDLNSLLGFNSSFRDQKGKKSHL